MKKQCSNIFDQSIYQGSVFRSQISRTLLAGVLALGTVGLILSGCASGNPKESQSVPVATQAQSDEPSNLLMTEMRQLTFEGPKSGEGYFSHDGKLMIYQSERLADNPFYQIYIHNRESGKTVMVSPGEGKTTCAWIHPSNQKALFSSTHLDPKTKEKAQEEFQARKNPVQHRYSWNYDENYDIFEAPIVAALKTGAKVSARSLKRLTHEKGYDAEASYSPNGLKIAFASNRAGYTEKLSPEDEKIFQQDPSYMMDIYLMNADGSNVERLTTTKGYDGGPFFSADGTKLTWRRFAPNGQVSEIMVMDLKTRKEKQITRSHVMSWAPFFHPSGDYIIYTSNKQGYQNFELYIVDTEGLHEPVRVSYMDGFDGLPVFLPNGKELSWTRKDEKGDSQIYLANWDDGLARELLGLSRKSPRIADLSAEIRIDDLKTWVSYLSSPALKGRRPGSREEREYVDTIGKAMRAMGLKPAFGAKYVEPFEFTSGVKLGPLNRLRLREGGTSSDLALNQDWRPLSISKSGEAKEAELVFAGYGIMAPANDKQAAFDSYNGIDVHGKWAVVLRDLPADIPPEKRFHYHLYSRPQHKALVAKQKGALGLVLVDSPRVKASEGLERLKFEGAGEVGIPVIHVSGAIADRLFQGASSLESRITELDRGEVFNEALKVSLGGKIDIVFEKSTGLNVAGKISGAKGRNALVVGAHGDHLGLGENAASLARTDEQGMIHYGADDNASGVASVLEVAHWLSDLDRKGKLRPEGDIIFSIWSGEELGVLGSTQFLKTWKGPKPYAYINLDMVGRLRDALYLQGTGSAKEWGSLLESWTESLPLSQREADSHAARLVTSSDPYLPTDAMPFYMKEIPVLSFFTGSHAEYHSPRDRYHTLNFSGMKEITETVDFFARKLSMNRPRLTWVKVESQHPAGSGESRSFRLYLGTVPDYTQDGIKGVKITGTSKDSPAEHAGLKTGDVIVGLGGIKIDSIYDYVYCLQALKADIEVPIKVTRDGRVVELQITPRLKSGG